MRWSVIIINRSSGWRLNTTHTAPELRSYDVFTVVDVDRGFDIALFSALEQAHLLACELIAFTARLLISTEVVRQR